MYVQSNSITANLNRLSTAEVLRKKMATEEVENECKIAWKNYY